jgi:ankyrin repeat protein
MIVLFAVYTPLHIACINGCYDIAEILLQAGANVNAQDFHGYTPLHLADLMRHVHMFDLLLRYGADPSIKADDGTTAFTLLHDFDPDDQKHRDAINQLTKKRTQQPPSKRKGNPYKEKDPTTTQQT